MRHHVVDKEIQQIVYIIGMLAQGRDVQGNHVEVIKQVVPETPCCNFFLQVNVGCGNHAQINFNRLITTEARE